MHPNSYNLMKHFQNKYLNPKSKLKIIDIGSFDVNGTYRDLFVNPNWEYVGLDIVSGKNVDILAKKPYAYPVEDESFDVVVSGNCMEHIQDIFAWTKECIRILKKTGIICIITPIDIPIHWGIDCWRIMPDGMSYLFNLNSINILECRYHKEKSSNMGDTIGIGTKQSFFKKL